jgi:hypothetical protein
MSGYFRDRYQGVGAIAAAAPAPRSAPAPSFGRLARTGGGGVCPQGCFPLEDGTCDCPHVSGGQVMQRRRRAAAPRVSRMGGRAMGAIQVDNEGGGGGRGGTTPPTTWTKSPLRMIMPGVLAPPVRTTSPTKSPAATIGSQPLTMVATAVPSPGYLPPRTPVKANVAGGGAGYPGSPAYTGGGGGALTQMAPPEMGPELELPGASASPGGLPGGAAKIWIALGLGAAAFFTYRHFKKRRRR